MVAARRVGIVCLACALGARALAAPPSPQAMKAAKQHYLEAKKFQDAANYDAAIVEYDAANKLAPKPVLLFNIAQCHRLKGDKLKAIESYEAFLAAAPDDAVADEAREHLTTLKLRIEVERAEAASKRAMEEAEIARKQNAEYEAARKRVETEERERRERAIADDENRRKRIVAEAEAERQRQVAAAADKTRRKKEAQNVGRTLRVTGGSIVAGGLVLFGLSLTIIVDADNTQNTINNLPNRTWSADGDSAVQHLDSDGKLMLALWVISGVMVVGGSVVAIVGAVQRKNALERIEARVVPLVSPTLAGLAVTGRF